MKYECEYQKRVDKKESRHYNVVISSFLLSGFMCIANRVYRLNITHIEYYQLNRKILHALGCRS